MSENAPTRSLDDIDLAALRVSYRVCVCTCMFTCLHLPGLSHGNKWVEMRSLPVLCVFEDV